MTAKKKRRAVVLAICATILLGLVIWTAWGNVALEQNTYTVSSNKLPKSFDGYRIAHISDLHNAEMGNKNEDILSMLKELQPNIIAITGDMIDSRNTNIEIALRFAQEAMKIAPCYYVTGNHEARVSEYNDFKDGLSELGVIVLDDERFEIERSGETIVLLGVNDPNFETDGWGGDSESAMRLRLQELMNPKDNYTVLLSHRPELFEVYAESNTDLVLSGHAHGGQFRFPFVGGLVAPDQGLFPEYDSGLYTDKNTNMIVSRGIGNSIFPFRFNNRPEIILIELKTA